MKKLIILSCFTLLILNISCDNDIFLEDKSSSLENNLFDNTKGKHSKTKVTYLRFPTKKSIEKMKRGKSPSRNYKYAIRIKKIHLKYVKNWSLNTFRNNVKFVLLEGSGLRQSKFYDGTIHDLGVMEITTDFIYSGTYAYIPVNDPLDFVNLSHLTDTYIQNVYFDNAATLIDYSSLFNTSTAKLPFRLDFDKGKFTIKYKRLNASQIKVSLGITNWKDNALPIKGRIEFIAKRNISGGFTGANFTVGTGNYKVYSSGNTLDISSSNFTFSFDKSGALKSIGADTPLGSNNKFFYGYGFENQQHTVKVTNNITKQVTSTVTTIYDNGDLGIGYKAQMSHFTGKIEYNTVGEFSMGIQFSYETP